MDGKPDRWKRAEPKYEERDKVSSGRPRVWNSVRDCEDLEVSIARNGKESSICSESLTVVKAGPLK